MKKHLRIIVITILSIFCLTAITVTPTFAAGDACDSGVAAVENAAGCNGNTDALQGTITTILESIIAIAGTISVIYIVVGGVQYMTSAGDSSKVEKAKKTILYACIGLIICALAFAIVNWTIGIIPNN